MERNTGSQSVVCDSEMTEGSDGSAKPGVGWKQLAQLLGKSSSSSPCWSWLVASGVMTSFVSHGCVVCSGSASGVKNSGPLLHSYTPGMVYLLLFSHLYTIQGPLLKGLTCLRTTDVEIYKVKN